MCGLKLTQVMNFICLGLHAGIRLLKLAREAVLAQWIRPRTLNREVPGSNLLAAAVEPLGKALYPHCIIPRKGLKAVGPLAHIYIPV